MFSQKPVCHCHVHVVTRERPFPSGSVKPSLKRLLCFSVVKAYLLRAGSSNAYKVKINMDHLHQALSVLEGHIYKVCLWKSHLSNQPSPVMQFNADGPSVPLSISSWNCRGLNSSEPYLQYLSDTILIQEHLLWPFDL